MKGIFPVERFQNVETPFYYYNADLLRETLNVIRTEAGKYNKFCVHYAIKANANPKILGIIRESGLGVDCVSGWEIEAAIQAGFPASKIVFAGVGKTDKEINLALDHDIFCFNVESVPELEVINQLAAGKNKIARVAFRINPDVGAHTHANITTGLAENKFGISMQDMDKVIDRALEMNHVKFVGLHFHIGSQILDMGDFIALCNRVNELQEKLYARQIIVEHINVGGGLGIDYAHPNRQSIPDFAEYFATYHKHLKLRPQQTLHFELGRSVVGQCGSLITRVIYVKQRHDRPHPPCPLPGIPQDRKHFFRRTGGNLRCSRTYLRIVRCLWQSHRPEPHTSWRFSCPPLCRRIRRNHGIRVQLPTAPERLHFGRTEITHSRFFTPANKY